MTPSQLYLIAISLAWWGSCPGMNSWTVFFLCSVLFVDAHQTNSACLLCPSFRQLSIPAQMGELEARGSVDRKTTEMGASSDLLWWSLTGNRPGFFIHHNLTSIMKLVNTVFFFFSGKGRKESQVGNDQCPPKDWQGSVPAHTSSVFILLVFWDLPAGISATVGTKLPVLLDIRPELGLHLALTLELITQLFCWCRLL